MGSRDASYCMTCLESPFLDVVILKSAISLLFCSCNGLKVLSIAEDKTQNDQT